MIRRLAPMRPSAGTRIPAAVRDEVRARDGQCVGSLLGWGGDCAGGLELDHVRPGGTGMKSPSTPDNLVSLCGSHHRAKTERGRSLRPSLIAYLERLEEGL